MLKKSPFFLLFFPVLSMASGFHIRPAQSPVFDSAPEYKAIMAELKPYGDFAVKKVVIPEDKSMSKGAQMVEEAKARNRELLAQRNKTEKETKKDELSGPALWKEETKKAYEGWRQEILEQRKFWQREQEVFLGRIKMYKDNTFEIPAKKEVIIEKKITRDLPDAHIVNRAFKILVRDQEGRPTCAAFAGIRAIEILLAQNEKDQDLSEQYLYWASKPKCQSSPCSEKGSWVPNGFRYSQKQLRQDIPSEENCGYSADSVQKNETQTPLSGDCSQGIVKVIDFEEVKTLADVIEKIQKDTPVIMAARLTENFYRNKGLVTLAESETKVASSLDGHSQGHAFLAVGVIELPQKLQKTEGSFCIVVANSWGVGWGAGGYSCLTQNWLNKYRQPSPFTAVTQVSFKGAHP
jgi:hypothetical protein